MPSMRSSLESNTCSERHRHRREVNPEYIGKLEKAGLIVSRKLGIYRRFYPAVGGRSPREIEEEIKRLLMEHPGMSQSGIASALNVTRQVINYHINKLLKKGQVIIRRSGRSSKIYFRGT